jgi:hypothetical protein
VVFCRTCGRLDLEEINQFQEGGFFEDFALRFEFLGVCSYREVYDGIGVENYVCCMGAGDRTVHILVHNKK